MQPGRAPVIVVGSVNVDQVWRVTSIARPGETVPAAWLERRAGGKGGNQAAAVARLGGVVHLVARVGADTEGATALDELAAEGVGTAHVTVDLDQPTGQAAVFVDDAGENAITVLAGANASLSPGDVEAAFAALPVPYAVVLACLEVPVATVLATAEAAHARGWLFVLNPAPVCALPAGLWPWVDVVTPNEHEARLLTPQALLAAGARAVVVTLGAAGATLHLAEAAPQPVPALPVEAVDTTGAGDAFSGALACALAEGADLVDAVRWASAAGALATREVGARAALPTRHEVQALLSS